MINLRILLPVLCLAAAGCGTSYAWRPGVPAELRSVSVPTFRNKTSVSEFGALMSRQTLRELQREGTFAIAKADDAVLQVQGEVSECKDGERLYDRREGGRHSNTEMMVTARVSVVDKRNQKVLISNREYRTVITYTASNDATTARRDASGRAADELSRQIVDDLVRMNWDGKKAAKATEAKK